ncbi:MAG: FMN-binding protein [Candidatus Eisenbacteria sp.]|nr:FMN-binding protein [Candidatus Eisenbacteria bacterium]
MRNFLRLSWLVLVCAFVFGLLLATVYGSWQPRIEENARKKLQRGIRSILADADSILTDTLLVDAGQTQESAIIYQGLSKNGTPVGYVFTAKGTGFQDRIELLVGVGPELKTYRGISVLFAAETPGFGDAIRDSAIFKCQFVGAPMSPPLTVIKAGDRNKTDDAEIVSITGATITSEAVTKIINQRWKLLGNQMRQGAAGSPERLNPSGTYEGDL